MSILVDENLSLGYSLFMVNNNLPAPQKGAQWIPVRRGSGEVTGYFEVFSAGSKGWFSVPGATRHADADGNLIAIE